MELPDDLEQKLLLRAQLLRITTERTAHITQAINTIQEYLAAEWSRIESEFGLTLKEVEESIKCDVVASGASFKANGWECRYRKGSITWDSKGLEGYAKLAPEVLEFRKEGKASAAFYELKSDQPGL